MLHPTVTNMDNASKKYVSMERLSSGDMLNCLTQLKAIIWEILKV